MKKIINTTTWILIIIISLANCHKKEKKYPESLIRLEHEINLNKTVLKSSNEDAIKHYNLSKLFLKKAYNLSPLIDNNTIKEKFDYYIMRSKKELNLSLLLLKKEQLEIELKRAKENNKILLQEKLRLEKIKKIYELKLTD